MHHFRLLSLLFILLLFTTCTDKETVIPQSSIQGIVKDEFGNLLTGVSCEITTSTKKIAITDQGGSFSFPKIDVGSHTIKYSKENYITGTELIEVKKEPTSITLILSSGASFLQLSDSILEVEHQSNYKDIKVESNTMWMVNSNVPWINITTNSGSGNKTISLNWESSSSDSTRKGVVTFKAGSIEKTVLIKQSPPLKLLSFKGMMGNHEAGIEDSINLSFSSPVTVNSISSSYEYCLSSIKHQVYSNKVSFTYACAQLGDEFPFTISVKDRKNQTYSFQFNVKLYNNKLNLPGYILDYFITEDNSTLWAVTRYPNKIIKVSLPKLTIERERDLMFQPTSISWNNYKKDITIFNNNSVCDYFTIMNGSCNFNNLMSLNPNTLEITSSKIKSLHEYDTYVFPRELCNFNDGTGVLLLSNELYHYNSWRLLDHTKNDTTYFHQSNRGEYQSIYQNFNKTKIYMMPPYGSTYIDILEKGKSVSRFLSPVPGRSNIFVPNKKHNRVFHGQLYEQFISDLNGYVSNLSYLDTRWFNGGLDFSYKKGEEETIYVVSDGNLQILDYKTQFTSLSTDTAPTLSNIQSTTDGENLIGYRHRGEGATDLFVFNIDEISTNKIKKTTQTGGRKKPSYPPNHKSAWVKK